MVSSRNLTSKRTASSTRLTVLLLFLLVVGVGCIYEFAFARPSFQAAWEKIQKIDQSRDSSNKTAAEIEELMGRPPFRTSEDVHEDCVVQTYRWQSGLLVKNHDIHIVYTKLTKQLEDLRPELKGTLYYYSASAGQPLDMDLNFPKEKQTIVENLNAPMMSLGGAPPPGRQQGEDKKGEDDKQADDKQADDKQADDKQADDKQADDKQADDKQADDKQADDKQADDKQADDKQADDKQADDKQADDKKADDKKADDKKADDKKADDKQGEGDDGDSR